MDYATLLTIVLALLFSMCAVSTVNTFTRSGYDPELSLAPGEEPVMVQEYQGVKLLSLASTLAVGAAAVLAYRRASVPTIAAALGVSGASMLGVVMFPYRTYAGDVSE